MSSPVWTGLNAPLGSLHTQQPLQSCKGYNKVKSEQLYWMKYWFKCPCLKFCTSQESGSLVPWAGWDQQLPTLTLGFIKPLLAHDYLGRSWRCLQPRQYKLPSVLDEKSSSLSTSTVLKAGLTLQRPWLLRLAVGWQGEEWNSSSEGVLMSSEFY